MAKTKFYITTTAANETASFYLGKGQGVSSTVTATISWGDETESSTITISGSSSQASHSYAEPGNYEATITTTSNAVSIYRSDSVAALSANITRVHVGDYVNKIGKYAFYNLANIDTVTIGDYVSTLTQSSFYKSGVKHIDMSESKVTSLPDSVFSNCTHLEDIELNEKITYIGPSAFLLCSALTEILLPATLTSIGDNGLGSTGLTTVKVFAKTPPTTTSVSFDGSHISAIYVPQDAVNAYTSSDWNDFGTITPLPNPTIPTDVTPTLCTLRFRTGTLVDTWLALGCEVDESGIPVNPKNEVIIDWCDGTVSHASTDRSHPYIYIEHNYYLAAYASCENLVTIKIYTVNGEVLLGSDFDGEFAFTNRYVDSVFVGDNVIGAYMNAFNPEPNGTINHLNSLTLGGDFRTVYPFAFMHMEIDSIGISDDISFYRRNASDECVYFNNSVIGNLSLGANTTFIADYDFENAAIDTLVFNSTTPPVFPEDIGPFASGTHTKILVPHGSIDAYTAALASTSLDPTSYTIYDMHENIIPSLFTFNVTCESKEMPWLSENEYNDVIISAESVGEFAIVQVDWGDGAVNTYTIDNYNWDKMYRRYGKPGIYNVRMRVLYGSIKLRAKFTEYYPAGMQTNLTSLIIGNHIEDIDGGTFYEAPQIDTLSILEDVSTISYSAFNGAVIGSLTIGENVASIDHNAFTGADIDTIVFNSSTPPTLNANIGAFKSGTHTTILVPNDAVDAYTAAFAATNMNPETYSVYSLRNKADVTPTEITFTTTTENEDVELNIIAADSNAKVIVDWANDSEETIDCDNVSSTEITYTYATAGTHTVKLYPVLGSINLSKQSDGSSVCAVSENITGITTGDYITAIDNDAVHSSNITLDTVNLVGGLTTLGERAFYGTTVGTLNVGSNVTSIGGYALSVATDSFVVPSHITVITNDMFDDASIDSMTINSSVTEIKAGALMMGACNNLCFNRSTPPTMAANSLKLSDGAVIHVPYGTTDAYTAVIEAADADPGNWTYTIVENPDPNRDPDEYDPDSIQDVPGNPAPEQTMSGDALKSILKAYGKNLKYIKTENNTIAVNTVRPGVLSITSDDLVIRSFNGYDFLECRSYDPFFGKPYYSLIRINDIRTFVIAQNARDQLDGFRC